MLRQHKRLSAGPATWRYDWDADDRLAGVTTPDGSRWRYQYDALGRRISKQRLTADGTGPVARIDFSWDDLVLAEQGFVTHDAAGTFVHTVTWNHEPGGHRPVAQVEHRSPRHAPQGGADGRFHAVLTDAAGLPVELVDPAGAVAWRSRCTVWGQRVMTAEPGAHCPLGFPGQYLDQETGAYYNFHRYYDPAVARYQSADPLGLLPGPNPYAYCGNPLSEIDPLGLSPYRLSDQNPVPKRFNDEYEKIKAMRAAERENALRAARGEPPVNPYPLGRPTPRGGWGPAQTRFENRPGQRLPYRWKDAYEWEVPGPNPGEDRILEGTDGIMGYSRNHYTTVKIFPAPWYPDGGKP